MNRIALFASGSGTNAENIIRYFGEHPQVSVACVFSNKPDAYVLKRAEKLGVATHVFDRDAFYRSEKVVYTLREMNVDYIILAGFLWLVPGNLINAFSGRIVNIHPALLPRYGGKGMYGMKVHEAVVASGDKETGITIHHVNERYDEGDIIFQATCPVTPSDTPEDVAKKVHELEYRHYPEVIEVLIREHQQKS